MKLIVNFVGMARPTKKTPELIDLICERIATSSDGLHAICKDEKMPDASQVYRWMNEDEEFRNKYARAKQQQADFMVEEIVAIANHTDEDHTPFTGGNVVQRDRLRIDSLKWIASKLAPKKYGDKLDIDLTDNRKKIAEAFPEILDKPDE